MDFSLIETERIADVVREFCLELQGIYNTTCVVINVPVPSEELVVKLNIALRSLVAPTVLRVYIYEDDDETLWRPIVENGELNFILTNIPLRPN